MTIINGSASGGIQYSNLFDPSKATLNQRWSNTSYAYQESGGTGMVVTDYIPISLSSDTNNPTIMHFKGATIDVSNTGFNYYDTSKTLIQASDQSTGTGVGATYPNVTVTTDEDGNYQTNLGWKGGVWHSEWANAAYMRVTLKVKDTAITSDDIQNIIITIDERIGG